MELNANKERVVSEESRWSGKAELPIEAELMIPDYQAPVFKIVKSIVTPVVLQKHAADRKLVLEGYLRCGIFYQSEGDNALCQVEQKISFSRTLELPEGIIRDELIQCTGQVEYMNCRATHSHRLELRGAYEMELSTVVACEKEIFCALPQKEVRQKKEIVDCLTFLPCGEKVVTCEEELTLTHTPSEIVEITGGIPVREMKKTQSKALVKANVLAKIYYRTADSTELLCQEERIPLRQVADIQGLDENSICQADITPLGWTLQESDEEGKVRLSVNGMLSVQAWNHCRQTYVEDAFVPRYETEVSYESLRLARLEKQLSEELTLECDLPAEKAVSVICCLGTTQPLRIQQTDYGCQVSGKMTLYCFYRNELGEIQCTEQIYPFAVGDFYDGAAEDWLICGSVQPMELAAQCASGGLRVQGKLTLSATLIHLPETRAVNELNIGAPQVRPQDSPALYLYYAQKGDSLFEIARRFDADPEQLTICNNLEQDLLPEDITLLVPQTE